MQVCFFASFFFLIFIQGFCQTIVSQKPLRYRPVGNEFVISNGSHRFNRALYGTNTAFRVETGDLPEFALYLPGMGGNFKFGIIRQNQSKWLTTASSIQASYHAGRMKYVISDPQWENASIELTVWASPDAEGMLIQLDTKQFPSDGQLVTVFGGVSGKRFNRDGDIGADPESSFDMKPEYCTENLFEYSPSRFRVYYAFPKTVANKIASFSTNSLPDSLKNQGKSLEGIFPPTTVWQLADATHLRSPQALLQYKALQNPVLVGVLPLKNSASYEFYIKKSDKQNQISYETLPKLIEKAEAKRLAFSKRIILETPDAFLNPVAAALTVAADAIWEEPSFLHGAVAWRMRLNAWRGPYCADPLGWHDRAQQHFKSYALSQVTSPPTGPLVADTALHLARHLEKLGTALFSEGYICRNPNGDFRAHHYDMNLVFIDQLLTHLKWTGDLNFAKQMWPVLKKHLAWEKRNFDADNDGLYDAYACIWASDALGYSGGGVTHSSAYNYRANKMAADIANLLGEDGTSYTNEANKILKAMQSKLWLKDKGWFAEYVDKLGLQLAHPAAALWTVYHAMEAGVASPLQQHQLLRYIDQHIPHIPIHSPDFPNDSLYLLSTTNWQPYTWSINNVALAENLHTALAYWQAGESDNAFHLWRSTLLESMYMGSSPGNFQQLSAYDAFRGELYRDFADPVGIAARSLVEGLFGVYPDALHSQLVIRPGFPTHWNFAKLETPDILVDFKQSSNSNIYQINSKFGKALNIRLQISAKFEKITQILVNQKPASWHWMTELLIPTLEIEVGNQAQNTIEIVWKGAPVIPKKIGQIASNVIQSVQMKPKLQLSNPVYEPVLLNTFFNDKIINLFKHKYLSPRVQSPTLALPWQGIGNWCYPLIDVEINDLGLRRAAQVTQQIWLDDIPFATLSDTLPPNILFTSRWDNFPSSVTIPLQGRARGMYLLMTGTTNHQQSQLENARISVLYSDGTQEDLPLINPQNWWPVEQDYYDNGLAFTTNAPKPYRLHLKTGVFTNQSSQFVGIKGLTNRAIEGGAATVLTLPLNPNKILKSVYINILSNEVIVGLMSITLVR
ncbi:MAG: DUF4450 domain-containing protein [Spirosomataceae bacterium]